MLAWLRYKTASLPSAMLLAGALASFAVNAAVTIDEFSWGRIYSSVGSDGVPFFTDIEPPELSQVSAGLAAGRLEIVPRAKVIAVKAANVKVHIEPQFEGAAGFTPVEPPSDEMQAPRED